MHSGVTVPSKLLLHCAVQEFESLSKWEAGELKPYQVVCRRETDRLNHLQLNEEEGGDLFVDTAFDKRNENVDWSESYIRRGGAKTFGDVDGWIQRMKHQSPCQPNGQTRGRKST